MFYTGINLSKNSGNFIETILTLSSLNCNYSFKNDKDYFVTINKKLFPAVYIFTVK